MGRTTKEMVGDAIVALESDLTGHAKSVVLRDIADEWTTSDGKYVGCRFWSVDALQLYSSREGKPVSERRRGLIHEHVVPKKVFISYLVESFPPWPPKFGAEQILEACFHDLLIACVVTEEEHRKLDSQGLRASMPKAFDSDDPRTSHYPLLRYEEAEITMIEVTHDLEHVLGFMDTAGRRDQE